MREFLDKKDYVGLEGWLSKTSLDKILTPWRALSSYEKLIVFKLLDAVRALEFFDKLSFEDKYLVFSGFPPQSVAPALEDLTPEGRRAFVALPRESYERMFRKLIAQTAAQTR